MPGNPPLVPPDPGQPTGRAFERYRRWYWSHVLHRLPGSKRKRIVRYAKASLAYAGKMVYTETAQRSELFHRKPGRFKGAHADCSQFSASLLHWAGVKSATDADWTGTLGTKGRAAQLPKPGMFVFFGAPPYVHMGVMVEKGRVIGFGAQHAPDENSLAGLVAYFAGAGHPGHAFRDLTV